MEFRRMMVLAALLVSPLCTGYAAANNCIECHRANDPGIVREFELSKHSTSGVTCVTCHGDKHMSEKDFQNAQIPTPDVCAVCHQTQFSQFSKGKHAKAWGVMFAMPTAHWQPMELMDGLKGCGGCHKIGLKSEDEMYNLKQSGGYGLASCDVCHTRHQFSLKEASAPQACRTCHMGVDHPQWEMYESSKHGVRYLLKQNGTLPPDTAAPTCQYCHLHDGNHTNNTAWGFLAVKGYPYDDSDWEADRQLILKALGVLDPQGNPTDRLNVVTEYDIAKVTSEAWQAQRDRMAGICSDCHSRRFVMNELAKGDSMVREADRLMAEAINIVADLYIDLVVTKIDWYAHGYSDVLTFHDAPTVIEQKLYKMFHEHRMRTFQGAFHNNPDYALWYGWSAMKSDLVEIRELADRMRREAGVR